MQHYQIFITASNPSNINLTSSNYIVDFSNYATEAATYSYNKKKRIKRIKTKFAADLFH